VRGWPAGRFEHLEYFQGEKSEGAQNRKGMKKERTPFRRSEESTLIVRERERVPKRKTTGHIRCSGEGGGSPGAWKSNSGGEKRERREERPRDKRKETRERERSRKAKKERGGRRDAYCRRKGNRPRLLTPLIKNKDCKRKRKGTLI